MATAHIEYDFPLIGLGYSGASFGAHGEDFFRPANVMGVRLPGWDLRRDDWEALGRPVDLTIRVEIK